MQLKIHAQGNCLFQPCSTQTLFPGTHTSATCCSGLGSLRVCVFVGGVVGLGDLQCLKEHVICPRSWHRHIQCLLRVKFLIHSHLPARSSYGEESEGTLWGLSPKGTNPIHEGSNHLPKTPTSQYLHTGD